MNTIVIDCGASFIKGALLSDGKIKKKIQKEAPKPDMVENILEPVQINCLLKMVRSLIEELSEDETIYGLLEYSTL